MSELQAIKTRIQNILIEELKSLLEIEVDDLNNNVIATYSLNSIDTLEILLRIENDFNIEIDDEDLNADLLSSVDKLSIYVLNCISLPRE
jgi:acyl carrier protein